MKCTFSVCVPEISRSALQTRRKNNKILPKLSTEQKFIYIMERAHKPMNYEAAHYIL